jgi:hypothetical protein
MLKKLVVLIFTLIIILSHTSYAAMPDTYTQYEQYLNTTTPNKVYEVFFPYGNQFSTKKIDNVSITLGLNKDSIEIVKGSMKDYFLTDELVQKNPNFPKSKFLDCTLVPKFSDENLQRGLHIKPKLISDRFYSNNKLNPYGPQSELDASTLNEGTTGCIGLSLKLTPLAKAGDIIEVKYNANTKFSSSYEEINRPGISTLAFVVTDGTLKCDVAKGEIYINTKCVPRCEDNTVLDFDTSSCKTIKRPCFDQEEDINGLCLQKCETNFFREANGVCKNPREIANTDQLEIYGKKTIIPYLIFVSIVSLVTLISIYLLNQKTKKRK